MERLNSSRRWFPSPAPMSGCSMAAGPAHGPPAAGGAALATPPSFQKLIFFFLQKAGNKKKKKKRSAEVAEVGLRGAGAGGAGVPWPARAPPPPRPSVRVSGRPGRSVGPSPAAPRSFTHLAIHPAPRRQGYPRAAL